MTVHPDTTDADRALKDRHRAMWALGDYPSVATEVIPGLGAALVDACRIGPGQRVLDVAAGSGNAAIPAALTGAEVVACDLTPSLLEAGRALAAARAAVVDWREGDAEALPFGDGSFDVVLSCVGVMFAPHHRVAAAELARVCRPGGTIAMINWTPQGFIGQLFGLMKSYVPPPPAGAQPPPLWGRADHVRDLFGGQVTEVTATVNTVVIDRFADGAQFRDYFKTHYGPTVAAYRNLAADPHRVAELDRDLADLASRHDQGGGVMHWEYLLWTGRRAG
jgi:ubiquinone/menaquinone biosynthesis C-methylase UbiE